MLDSLAISEIGGTGGEIINTLMYGSLGVNLAIAASLSMVWGMISVLQMILNMPLMNVNFPSNVIIFYNVLLGIASLEILPAGYLDDFTFTFEEDSY